MADHQHKRSWRWHRCEDNAPTDGPASGTKDEVWLCPTCRRRWLTVWNGPGRFYEGVYFYVGDWGYWRSFRCRIIGRIWF